VSFADLKRAIDGLRAWHEDPKPFIWTAICTASVGRVIEKIDRARIKTERIEPGSTLPRAIL
jgi:hypothetical protein